MEAIFDHIREERKVQDAKWGEQRHNNFFWFAILLEEVGEAAKALLEGSWLRVEDELIQAAAVIVCWIESSR